MKVKTILVWGARIVASLILLQTLYFKFSAAPESVFIFTTVGMEPWGRIGTGVVELLAGLLLLVTGAAWIGAVLALGLMLGAIAMHLTVLGIDVQGDNGQLFYMACIVAVCSVVVLVDSRVRIVGLLKKVRDKSQAG